MFTGLVEEVAKITQVRSFSGGRRFELEAACGGQIDRGDSVALDGVCLTAEATDARTSRLWVAAVTETLRRTTAGSWRRGAGVHLERAVLAGGRLGGHLVQGHVDGVATVLRAGRAGREFVLALRLPRPLRRYLVSKGSLAVNGVSLTVGSLSGSTCRLFIIPETLERTLIGRYRPGQKVNLEVDLVAKYVEALSERR
jgi:riboflavin synthase